MALHSTARRAALTQAVLADGQAVRLGRSVHHAWLLVGAAATRLAAPLRAGLALAGVCVSRLVSLHCTVQQGVGVTVRVPQH